MTEQNKSTVDLTADEKHSAHFANLVLQQANMALMLMGQLPHPESGEKMHDLEGAQFFVDQLEMLEAKTRGNLSATEEKLLKQSLTNVRLAFVESVSKPVEKAEPKNQEEQKSTDLNSVTSDDSSGKRFSKKY